MKKCEIDHNDHRNNGLITKVWGSPGWNFLHAITFGYPIEPSDEQKKHYHDFFVGLGNVLPCKYCRESYQRFISEGSTKLDYNVLKNRESLTLWFYEIHEAVNTKLEMNYGIKYQDLVDKYESFRARCSKPIELDKSLDNLLPTQQNLKREASKGCVVPVDYKAFSFKRMYHFEAPIIPLEMAKKFVPMAKMRGLSQEYFAMIELAKALNGDFEILKQQTCWFDRDEYCYRQIKFMREHGEKSVEDKGIWQGSPSIQELKLIMFLSSNLNTSELQQANKCLNIAIKKIKEKKVDF